MRVPFILTVLVLALAQPVAAEVSVYTKGAVQVVSKAKLGPHQKQGFSKFKARARDFSGAFYISTGVDDGSFWVDEHRLEDAKTYARAACMERAKGSPCVLYAVIVPVGPTTGAGNVLKNIDGSLARTLATGQKKGKPGSYGAAAANRIGQFGVGWGYESRERARKEALFTCIKGIKRRVFKDQVSAQVYNDAVSGGKFDCKLVAEFHN